MSTHDEDLLRARTLLVKWNAAPDRRGDDVVLAELIAEERKAGILRGRRQMASLVLNTPSNRREQLCIDELQTQARKGESAVGGVE